MRSGISYKVAIGTLILAVSLGATQVLAELEEIVVTAQKREQSLQDVGLSVTAFNADQIKELGFETTVDLVSQTPGLGYVAPFGNGNNVAFTLRGVGLNDFSEANEAPVAVYVDGVYNATLAGIGFQLFDIERAEVLRGPQGTLYGRNTTGGLVHFITRKPGREPGGYVEVSGGEHQQVRAEWAVGGPLGDRVSARLSALYHTHDGFQDNATPGVADAGETNNVSGRLQVLFEPSDSTSVLFNVHGGSSDQVAAAYKHKTAIIGPDGFDAVELPADVNFYGTCAGCDLTGYRDTSGDFYETANDREPFVDLETFGVSATVEHGWNDYLFKSITAYERVEKLSGEDTDVTPSPFIEVTNPVDSKQISQEFQLSGLAGENFWLIGFYYYKRDLDSGTRTDLSREMAIGFPINNNTEYSDETDSLSLYGQYEWALNESWKLVTGVRFTTEERQFDMLVVDDNGLLPNPVFDFTSATVGDLTKHDRDYVSFRAELNWQATDDLLWYGFVSKGIKGAGFNIDIGIDPRAPADIPFDEEELLAYELGLKSTIGGNTRFNASVFHYDYQDFQAFSFEGLSNVVSNKDASVTGLDAELTSSPVDGLDIGLGLSVLDAEVEDINTGVSIVDRNIPLSPDVTFNALVRYEWAAFGGTLALQADAQYVDKQHFDILNTTIATEDSYTVGNLRATYLMGSRDVSFSVYVKNITDEEYRTYAIPVPGLGFAQNMVGRPRWVGATVSVRW